MYTAVQARQGEVAIVSGATEGADFRGEVNDSAFGTIELRKLCWEEKLQQQGTIFRSLLAGDTPDDWQTSMYYRYWMHLAHHHVYAHYGVRTLRYKLIYYYADGLDQPGVIDETKEPEWELFDLDSDPDELNNVYSDPAYADVVEELTAELYRLQAQLGDEPYDHPSASGTWRG